MDSHAALAALGWQIDLGADEAIGDEPIDRFALDPKPEKPPVQQPTPIPARIAEPEIDTAREAEVAVKGVSSLEDLRTTLAGFEHCDLKKGARNTVFADGNPAARLMIIGEAPGRDEDREGRPFVGRAGQLLDKMLAAIGMDRASTDPETAVYITNILPWRPPQNRDPEPAEIAMLMPFVKRHVELVEPDLIVCMGNISCQGVLGRRGITRMRGNWDMAFDTPVMPTFHPAYLLRNPIKKRDAWRDLLAIQAKLKDAKSGA